MTTGELSDRTALVTGGASGIGRSIALGLARRGANIALMSMSGGNPRKLSAELKHFASATELETTRTDICALGRECLSFEGDVASEEDVARMVQDTAEAFGGIDVLINNAATNCVHPVHEHDNRAWKRIIDVNLYGAYLCTRETLPLMLRAKWGRIISIASTNAHVGTPEYSAYAASKHGLLGFNRSLALEIAEHGITANTISPGIVETPSGALHLRKWAEREQITTTELRERFVQSYPAKRFIAPQEIADLVCFLCDTRAAAINGEDIAITTGAAF